MSRYADDEEIRIKSHMSRYLADDDNTIVIGDELETDPGLKSSRMVQTQMKSPRVQ